MWKTQIRLFVAFHKQQIPRNKQTDDGRPLIKIGQLVQSLDLSTTRGKSSYFFSKMLVCIQRLNAFCNALVTKRVKSNKIKHAHQYLKKCHVRVQETHEFRVKAPNHRMLLTGSRLPSSESSVCSGVDSTQISTPGLRKQVQSYIFACLDLTRRFAKGPLSLIIQG